MNLYEEPCTPLTNAQIVAIEAGLGHKLPVDYIRFLKAMNGGYIKEEYWRCMKITSTNGKVYDYPLTHLYGFYVDAHLDILSMVRRSSFLTPVWLLPVGSVHESVSFFLNIRAGHEGFGNVYLFDMEIVRDPCPVFRPEEFLEEYDDPEEADEIYGEFVSHYRRVADSFTEFLGKVGISIK